MPKSVGTDVSSATMTSKDYKDALLALKRARHTRDARQAVIDNSSLSAAQKIDVLYTALLDQRRHQGMTNLFWSVVGAVIGLLLTVGVNLLMAHHP